MDPPSYKVFRVPLTVQAADAAAAEEVYSGQGVDFSSLYDREDFIVVQKNFDEISFVEISSAAA